MRSTRRITNYTDFHKWLKELNYSFFKSEDFDIPDVAGIKLTTTFGVKDLNGMVSMTNMITTNKKYQELISLDKNFYDRNGYIEVERDPETNILSLKKRVKGRPSSIKSKDKNVTLRMSNEEIEQLDNYCNTNNIKRSEAIRIALEKLLNQ